MDHLDLLNVFVRLTRHNSISDFIIYRPVYGGTSFLFICRVLILIVSWCLSHWSRHDLLLPLIIKHRMILLLSHHRLCCSGLCLIDD